MGRMKGGSLYVIWSTRFACIGNVEAIAIAVNPESNQQKKRGYDTRLCTENIHL